MSDTRSPRPPGHGCRLGAELAQGGGLFGATDAQEAIRTTDPA